MVSQYNISTISEDSDGFSEFFGYLNIGYGNEFV